jgi:hypothetical protein
MWGVMLRGANDSSMMRDFVTSTCDMGPPGRFGNFDQQLADTSQIPGDEYPLTEGGAQQHG